MSVTSLDARRIRVLDDRPLKAGRYVLYWMIASRRTRRNPALQRAVELCEELNLPLVVFEPLRIGYRWASLRHHTFVTDGMRDNAAVFARHEVTHVPWLEPAEGAGKGVLAGLARDAAVVVTDDSPTFFLPRMLASVRLACRVEAVDGIGLLPLSASPRAFPTASGFRRHVQRTAALALACATEAEPLQRYRGGRVQVQVPPSGHLEELGLDPLPAGDPGGSVAAEACADGLFELLERYHTDRKHPDKAAVSGLSPYLHHGQISAEDLVHRILEHCGWQDQDAPVTGSRGWWGLPEGAEALLDELITWRELAHTFAWHRAEHDQYGANPEWARKTLAEHVSDERTLVSPERLEAAESPDPLWNAAQRELVQTGRMQPYLRMLWGKCVLAWMSEPEAAFDWLLHINNKYALDGRDPNSTAGVGWVFGRHDRAWGPERSIYGKVRYMTSNSTVKKLCLKRYLETYGLSR